MSVAPSAEVLISEREEPVTNFTGLQGHGDQPAEVRPGDFVVVDVGEKPGMADRVVVTQRNGIVTDIRRATGRLCRPPRRAARQLLLRGKRSQSVRLCQVTGVRARMASGWAGSA